MDKRELIGITPGSGFIVQLFSDGGVQIRLHAKALNQPIECTMIEQGEGGVKHKTFILQTFFYKEALFLSQEGKVFWHQFGIESPLNIRNLLKEVGPVGITPVQADLGTRVEMKLVKGLPFIVAAAVEKTSMVILSKAGKVLVNKEPIERPKDGNRSTSVGMFYQAPFNFKAVEICCGDGYYLARNTQGEVFSPKPQNPKTPKPQ